MRRYSVLLRALLAGMVLASAAGAEADECVKVAAIFSLTGEGAAGQRQTIEGIRIAEAEIRSRKGGPCLRMILLDDRNTPIGAHLAAEAAVEKKVSAIVGPARSTNALMVAKVAQAGGIPAVATAATDPAVTRTGRWIFRAGFTDTFQGRILAEFARGWLRAETAVIVRKVSSDYSISLSRIFRETFEAAGGRIAAEIDYLRRHRDFQNRLAPLESLPADILFIPGHSESGAIARQAAEMGLSAIPLGGDGWASQSFLQRGGAELKHGYYLTHWSAEIDSRRSRDFVAAYGPRHDLNPGMALSYDTLHLLWDAVKRAGSPAPEAIRDALAATRNFHGVTGQITFDGNGDPVKPAVIMEIVDGIPRMVRKLTP